MQFQYKKYKKYVHVDRSNSAPTKQLIHNIIVKFNLVTTRILDLTTMYGIKSVETNKWKNSLN